jgi:fructose 1,6-bisphosphate aldolase/phosphatase
MFDDPSFDVARQECNQLADHMRRHGPFEPHRLPMEEMEYTTMPQVMERLERRWEDLKSAMADFRICFQGTPPQDLRRPAAVSAFSGAVTTV